MLQFLNKTNLSVKKENEPGMSASLLEKFLRNALHPWPGYRKVYNYGDEENKSKDLMQGQPGHSW